MANMKNNPAGEDAASDVVALVGTAEAASILGVSKQRVAELYRLGQMPAPLAVLRATPVWDMTVVEEYAATRKRTPGPEAR